MKKILLSLCFLLSFGYIFAQHPIGVDSFALQTLGSSNTFTKSKGAIGSEFGLVNAHFVDTATANLNKISHYPGAQIMIGDTVLVRNHDATQWLYGSSGSSAGNFVDSLYIAGSYLFWQKSGIWQALQLPQDSADIYVGYGTGTDTLFKIINGDTSIVTYLDRPDGSIDCRVTHLTGLNYNVSSSGGTSPCVFILGGKRYNVTGADITLTNPDPVYPRRDYIGVDTSGIPVKIDGIADPAPTLPAYDHGSQLMLQDFILYPGDTTGSVYSGIRDSVGVVHPILSDSTTWPGHQTLSLDVNHMPRLDYEGSSRDTTTWVDTTLIDKGFLKDRLAGFSGGGSVGSGISKIIAGYGQTQVNDSTTNNDTTVMATVARLLSDSTILANRINLKLNISDTAAMLSNYLKNINGLVTAGTNVTITGSGTSGSPYVVNSSGAGSPSADQQITATASQTSFTFSAVPSSYNDFWLDGDGSTINQNFYTKSGDVITLTTGLGVGTILTMHYK